MTIVSYSSWELPEPPEALADAPIDVVIASSRFTQRSFMQALDNVVYLPLLVDVSTDVGSDGRAVGGPFVFLSLINLCSFASRKNPRGIIEAFGRAFPGQDFGVKLALKISGSHCDAQEFMAICRSADADRRIEILDQPMSRSDTIKLFDTCDAYVSLHRSEGFGRTIAEAMSKGKPVIATGWSGSMDLTSPSSSLLCDFQLRPLRHGEYVCSAGQKWAEPKIEHAAKLMRHLVEMPMVQRKAMGQRAQDRISTHFSLEANLKSYGQVFSSQD